MANQIPPHDVQWWRAPFWRFVLIGAAYLVLIASAVFIVVTVF